MSALAKIRKQAAQLEHDRQYDKALALYARLLTDAGAGDEEIDVPLYNRAGDVALRAGNVDRAIAFYERALDLYAAGGFLNNAIALGAKILRHDPQRASAHYTLGVLHARRASTPTRARTSWSMRSACSGAARRRGGTGDERLAAICATPAEAHASLALHLDRRPVPPPEVAAGLAELLAAALPQSAAPAAERMAPDAESTGTGHAGGELEPMLDAGVIGDFLPPRQRRSRLRTVWSALRWQPRAGRATSCSSTSDSAGSTMPRGSTTEERPSSRWGPSDRRGTTDRRSRSTSSSAASGWGGADVDLDLLDFDPGWTGRRPSERSTRRLARALARGGHATVGSGEIDDSHVVGAESSGPLSSELPGELPPLTVSMLALAGSAADWESASAPEPPLWDTPALLGASWDGDFDARRPRAGAGARRDAGNARRRDRPPRAARIDWEAIEPLDPAAELPPVDLETGAPAPVDPELPAAVTSLDPTAGRDGPGPDAMPAELVYGDIVLEVAVPVELPPTAADTPPEDGLDLGAWLRATEPARSTRLIAPVLAPTGDEEADFRATLAAFRRGSPATSTRVITTAATISASRTRRWGCSRKRSASSRRRRALPVTRCGALEALPSASSTATSRSSRDRRLHRSRPRSPASGSWGTRRSWASTTFWVRRANAWAARTRRATGTCACSPPTTSSATPPPGSPRFRPLADDRLRAPRADVAALLHEIQSPVRDRLDRPCRTRCGASARPTCPSSPRSTSTSRGMKGKMFRPTLVLLASAVDESPEARAVTLAATLEVLHLATLVHDDAVDHSVLRRGMPTINALFSHQVSVIMGDFLYARALTELVRLNDWDVAGVFADASTAMTLGEMRQLGAVDALAFSEDDYHALIRAKTASLFRAACDLGALSGARRHRDALVQYGERLGMAFQVVDDLLDYTEGQEMTGKPTGLDLREHKVTLPLIAALRTMRPADRRAVEQLFATAEPDDRQVGEVIALVAEQGGLEYARRRGDQFAREAEEALADLPESTFRTALVDAIGYVLDRRW
jgi:octaprenyl-diphosphate synthase